MSERKMGRWHLLRQIQSSRLGGADRIMRDDVDQEPRRYAHICENSSGTTVHTTDGQPDPAYSGWKHSGTIDLDTGDLVIWEDSDE